MPALPIAQEEPIVEFALPKRIKICFLSSGGGHFAQIRKLQLHLRDHEQVLITTAKDKCLRDGDCGERRYFTRECGQGQWKRNPGLLLVAMVQIARVLLHERPCLLISTGAGVALPAFLAAKLLGIKTIYIEAYARTRTLSLTGRLSYWLVDLFMVQHRLLQQTYSRTVYCGPLYDHLPGEQHDFPDRR